MFGSDGPGGDSGVPGGGSGGPGGGSGVDGELIKSGGRGPPTLTTPQKMKSNDLEVKHARDLLPIFK